MTHADATDLDATLRNPFLDLVVNVVGVLILLVLVAGGQGRATPLRSEPDAIVDELAPARQAAQTLEGDLNRLVGEIDTVRAEAASRLAERNQLSLMLAAVEHELAQRRAALDDAGRKQFDQHRALAAARADLQRLEKLRGTATERPDRTVKIESYPTPLSKPVDNKEVHFQIKRGRIAYVPLNEFLSRLQSLVGEKQWKLRDTDEFTETAGPVDGFNMRYTIAKLEIPWEEASTTGVGGVRIMLDKAEFLPVSSQLGEPIDEALSSRSAFRGRLDDLHPQRTTITMWIYPDSFDEFRRLRKELYERGFSVAARPLDEWMYIGGSPHGSKSAAE